MIILTGQHYRQYDMPFKVPNSAAVNSPAFAGRENPLSPWEGVAKVLSLLPSGEKVRMRQRLIRARLVKSVLHSSWEAADEFLCTVRCRIDVVGAGWG